MNNSIFETDLLVIGGGINGTGIAADAAGRGLSVILCEKGDLAQGTSSASTKLIHGGLRYLEQFDFKLVHEALREREILLKRAPFLVHPLKFILPYEDHLRPIWMIRSGLFFYDLLSFGSKLPHSKKLNLKSMQRNPLKQQFDTAFSYFDCQTDDARLVVLNALTAQEKGAKVLTRIECVNSKREKDHWNVECLNLNSSKKFHVIARAVINAGGPWANEILNKVLHIKGDTTLSWVKGSHIIVPKFYEGDNAFILQLADSRIIFVIPYYEKFNLIGTTDIPYKGSLDHIQISEEETQYLIGAVNNYFQHQISLKDIIWNYSGVRALYGNDPHHPSKISREYFLKLNEKEGQAPLLTIFGGKLTTYRSLAEHALKIMGEYFPHMGKSWTHDTPLPGGNFNGGHKDYLDQLKEHYPFLPHDLLYRYINSYGTRTQILLKSVKSPRDLGKNFGADLFEKEIIYLIEHEWAKTVDDIIWRRTKLGLILTEIEKAQLADHLQSKLMH